MTGRNLDQRPIDPQDYPDDGDEEAKPDRVDDQLLEPLRGQSIPPPAGDAVGSGFASGRLLHEVAGTRLAATASRPRPPMLSFGGGGIMTPPNAGWLRTSQDARRADNRDLAGSVPAFGA